MKRWKTINIGLFVALCILLNYAGRTLAQRLSLPLWLDSFGTVLCAYVGGPVCGAIVGATGNLIYGMAIQSDMILPDNIEVRKIPKDLLKKCSFESEVR